MKITERLSRQGFWGRALALATVLASLFVVYLAAARPWFKAWGATGGERQRWLPGDDIVPAALESETRAITIAAPPAVVWAWISQLGQDRGGFYSYEVLEDLVGCEMPGIYRLDPALQRWSLGDKLWMYPPRKLGGAGAAELVRLDPGHALGFATRAPGTSLDRAADGSWTFVVEPSGAGPSRLLIRGRSAPPRSTLASAFTMTVFDPMHFAMERRTMETIRDLSEGRGHARWSDDAQVLLWALTFAGLLTSAILVLAGRRPVRHLLAVLSAGLIFQFLTFAQPPVGLGLLVVLAWAELAWTPAWRLTGTGRAFNQPTSQLAARRT